MNTLNTLLTEMLERGGSDLHLSVGAPPKTRIDGVVRLRIRRLEDAAPPAYA